MTEITKKSLTNLIFEIGEKIDKLNIRIFKQDKEIELLKSKNKELQIKNHNTLDQIKEYIEELEQIKNHYVNNNNNTGG